MTAATAAWSEAADRVRTFVAARDHHRARIAKAQAMMGRRPTNPLPNLIMAEYGVLDVEDLRVLVSGEVAQ